MNNGISFDDTQFLEQTKSHFNRFARLYDFTEYFTNDVREEVIPYFGDTSNNVLDVACGTGSQSVALLKAGYKVTGLDISEGMLAKAKQKAREFADARFVQGDSTKMAFSDGNFDVSTISFALHDMPFEIACATLKEMRRVTKPAGKIIVVDYNPHGSFLNWLFKYIAITWETSYYRQFIKRQLSDYLATCWLSNYKLTLMKFGLVQVFQCDNSAISFSS